jgi:hypothetical protein
MAQLVRNTNGYGKEKIKNWKTVDQDILVKFFGCLLLISMIRGKDTPLVELWYGKLKNHKLASLFPYEMFTMICSGLHWINNEDFSEEEKKSNKAYKISSMLDKVMENSRKNRSPKREVNKSKEFIVKIKFNKLRLL